MATLFGILQIGARGVYAAQAGLNTTGHNIANANTEGFSRQRVTQSNATPIILPDGALGQGVDIQAIQRVRDDFIERQIRNAQSESSFFDQQEVIFGDIASILNDPLSPISESAEQSSAGGLNNLLARFYASWNDLSLSPEAPEVRSAVIESGVSLAETFSRIDQDLTGLRRDLDTRVRALVDEINNIAQDLVRINQRIAVAEVGVKVTANDLRDQRDRLLRRLSEIIPIEANVDETGQVSVTLLGNRIVDQQTLNALTTRPGLADGEEISNVSLERQGIITLDDKLQSGELGALVDGRDRLVTGLLDEIDRLARDVVSEVNRLHSASVGLDGFSEISTQINLPTGASVAGSGIPLDTIFNDPRLPANPTNADVPFAIENGSMTIRIADENGATRQSYDIAVRTTDNMEALRERIDRADGIVAEVMSGASFDPVFNSDVISGTRLSRDAVLGISGPAQTIAQLFPDTPAAINVGPFTMDVHIRDVGGTLVDSNPATQAVDPFQLANLLPTDTMTDFVTKFNTATGGRVIAQLIDLGVQTNEMQIRFTAGRTGETFSIQQDASGVIQSLSLPITDPSLPLLGGVSGREEIRFAAGEQNTAFIGAANPNFSTVFPGLGTSGNGPDVIGAGDFELVAVDVLGNVIATETVTLAAGATDTLTEIAADINAFWAAQNGELTATIDAVNNDLIIDGQGGTRFFFRNDETGIVQALGRNQTAGYGLLNGQPFNAGEFEVVVANRDGTVTDIFQVPVFADPADATNGVASLTDIADRFNRAAASVGAPLSASIVADPQSNGANRIRFAATEDHQFTFRSDDSRLLSALGLHRGPALDEVLQAPIEDSPSVIQIGNNIGPMVKAEFDQLGQIKISTVGSDEVTFTNDTSGFLAAAEVNVFFRGTDANTMRVSELLRDNRRFLAASKTGAAGDNQASLQIAELQHKNVLDSGSHGDFYRSVVAGLGLEGARVSQFLDTNNKILTEFTTLQEQQSGVSLDEESINLIQYQQAFTASARVISTINEILDLVMNL